MLGFGRKKKDVYDQLFGADAATIRADFESAMIPAPASQAMHESAPMMALPMLAPFRYSYDDGTKFPGGYGPTNILITDYWTLRARSAELFESNLYARGLIRRLVTNEINVGLHLEATPEEDLLGYPEDGLAEWAEETECRFELWAENPVLCDQAERLTFGQLQAAARMEALVAGDVLVVNQQSPQSRLPKLRLINGAAVQTPLEFAMSGKRGANRVVHGIEIDPNGRHVAFWIQDPTDPMKGQRLPAFGEKSGRRLAWMVYGTDKRADDVRGKPLLALILQSLKEIDRFRDATQRKAVINSMLALFVKKGEATPGTRPLTGGAIRRTSDTTFDSNGAPRTFTTQQHIPGVVIDELQHGEEPQAFQTNGTVETFGVFEEAMIQAIAWANEVPPEILTLGFSSNYSASQAAINEFKIYLNRVRTDFGNAFCKPVYLEWLLAETLLGKIDAPGLLEAFRDFSQYDTFGAWTSSDWSGHIKPAVDMTKLVKGYAELVNEGFITRDRAARELTGSKYSKNVQKIARENAELAEARSPLAQQEAAAKSPAPPADKGTKTPGQAPAEDDAAPEEERLPN